jgi:DNA-binding protein YbaB
VSTPYDEHIEELLQQYRAQRARASELQRELRETTASATAPRQAVKVTVGAQGEVRALEFPTGAYRRMAPTELAEVLMTTIQEAADKAAATAAAVLAPHLPEGLGAADVLRGRNDLSSLLPEEPPMLDSVRAYVDHGRFTTGGLDGPRFVQPPA